ncbi:MAG: methyltransferase domain-containing protein [Pseudomonadota bacterium]
MTAFTQDMFLGGAVKVFQPEAGFRAGVDSLLLAAALDSTTRGEVLEIGCGAGGALLPAAWRLKDARFAGLEKDPGMAELARKGVTENGLTGRAEIIDGDAAALPPDFENRFDVVFSNPPFFEPGTIKSPGKGKTDAYLSSLPLERWIKAMLFAARPKGTVLLIHRAAALTEILAALHRRAGEIAVMPVRASPRAEAKRVIVRARKALRPGPTRLLAGIDLHDGPGGERSEISRAVAERGEGLDWSG